MMKNIKLVSFLLMLAVAAACGDDEPGGTDERTKKINALTVSPWVTVSVEHDTDGDLTFQYEDFSISFSKDPAAGAEGDYVVTNGGNAFPVPFGKWSLSDDLKTLSFTSGQELSIESLTDGSLILNFVVEPNAGGRIEGVSGEFTFTLKH
jgi:hypothetical protein